MKDETATEDQIRAVQIAIGNWCWRHDFEQFCAVTGWTGTYAAQKWRDLQGLNEALAAFDPATLAKIVSPPTEESPQ